MNKLMTFFLALAFLVLAGCASAPELAPVMTMPPIPTPKEELIQVDLEFASESKLDENAVQLASHQVEPGSSVVINVPSGLFVEQSSNAANPDFKTKDFFNEAEQQIERVFIRNGFRVLSRSKFEAKLRSLRDESRCNLNEYRCLHSEVSPEVKPILEDLKAKFDKGEIDALEYADQIRLFKDKLTTASAGRRRSGNEKELTDISEVIRAAESGDVRADYILQINMFDTGKRYTVTQDLLHNPAVRDFVRKYPAIRKELENGNNTITCAVLGAQLNAKLIHVKTGAIVWIGEHQLDEFSSSVQNVSVELGQKTYVANTAAIEQFIDQQNTSYARQLRYGKRVDVPAWEFRTALIKPIVSAGRCEETWTDNDEIRTLLARKVAGELINTISLR